MKVTYHVYRSGRTWSVYRQPATDGTGQELVEGGFFTKAAAHGARNRWEREALSMLVAQRPHDKPLTFSALLKGERFYIIGSGGCAIFTKVAAGVCKDAEGQWLNVRSTTLVQPIMEVMEE